MGLSPRERRNVNIASLAAPLRPWTTKTRSEVLPDNVSNVDHSPHCYPPPLVPYTCDCTWRPEQGRASHERADDVGAERGLAPLDEAVKKGGFHDIYVKVRDFALNENDVSRPWAFADPQEFIVARGLSARWCLSALSVSPHGVAPDSILGGSAGEGETPHSSSGEVCEPIRLVPGKWNPI
jgi:hypothetical protein